LALLEDQILRICDVCTSEMYIICKWRQFIITLYRLWFAKFNTKINKPRITWRSVYWLIVHPRCLVGFVLLECFVDRCLSFCTFSSGHCVVCSSSIYGFWLPLWYFQTLLVPLSIFFWPLYYKFLFDLVGLIAILVYSNFSCWLTWAIFEVYLLHLIT